MYNKEQSISISCDNCGDVYINEHTGFSLYPDEIGAHESADNDGWYSSEGEHYCPLCHSINDNDDLIIDSGRTILHEASVPVKEDDYYPGKSYQRLFDVVNESGPTPTITQMQDIIHVVHEDFPASHLQGKGWISWNELPDDKKEIYYDKARGLMSDDLMFCTRVWSAWGIGTMTEDDFVVASGEDSFVIDVAIALYNESNPHQQGKQSF